MSEGTKGRAFLIQGDARRLALADKSVHTLVTSPPYWVARDYNNEGTEWPEVTYCPMPGAAPITIPAMRRPLGLEPTPEAFVGHMVLIFREAWRVLRDDGTAWVNFGDSYASGGKGGGGSYMAERREGAWQKRSTLNGWRSAPPGLKDKDAVGIPWRMAFAFQADGWTLRGENIWHKPNVMPLSVTDRTTTCHEYVFLLTKRPRYCFDHVAIQEATVTTPRKAGRNSRANCDRVPRRGSAKQDAVAKRIYAGFNERYDFDAPLTSRNARSVWRIAVVSMKEKHFAAYPPALPERCIRAGTSERGCCPTCGAQWARVVDKVRVATRPGTASKVNRASAHDESPYQRHSGMIVGNRDPLRHVTETQTVGWVPGCRCYGPVNLPKYPRPPKKDAPAHEHESHRAECAAIREMRRAACDAFADKPSVPCTVLDNFNGSGTTGMVAVQLGRNYVGNELNKDYIEISRRRIAVGYRPPKAKRPRRPKPPKPEPTLF